MTDYSAPLDTAALITEVASGAFAFRNKLRAPQIKLLWEKLCEFIVDTLRHQKGVLLSNLGSFRVGPVIGEAGKKIRPVFTLLEGRYGGLSQERSRYVVGGRTPIIQPNYGQLSVQTAIHRGATQRLVAEILQRLGVHILSGRPIKCDFPGLGLMQTNRAGRFEFVFNPLVLEWFEREHYALIKEMELHPEDQQMLKALQRVNMQDYKSPRPSRPVSAASGVTKRDISSAPPAPYHGEVLELYRLCRLSDRTRDGTVSRLVLEGFLQREVRSLVSRVDAGTLLDLLAANTIDADAWRQAGKTTVSWHLLEHVGGSPRYCGEEDDDKQESDQAQPGNASDAVAEVTLQDMLQPALSPLPPDHHQQYHHQLQQQQQPHQSYSPPSTAPEQYIHYTQAALSPRSRLDYDNFNRMHFHNISQARGTQAKRAVTPKVGEEPLNKSEFQAVRQVSPACFDPAARPATSNSVSPLPLRPPSQPGSYAGPLVRP
ncbi:hypothetical protein QJQ45_001570 [Haematococcus lacustris]|nr:hypothetical protein QJQ45_001570 [Haematococcus lacustris]